MSSNTPTPAKRVANLAVNFWLVVIRKYQYNYSFEILNLAVNIYTLKKKFTFDILIEPTCTKQLRTRHYKIKENHYWNL